MSMSDRSARDLDMVDTVADYARPTQFTDGRGLTAGTEGCVCTDACEMPCCHLVGMTTRGCCPGCAELPAVEDDDSSKAQMGGRDA